MDLYISDRCALQCSYCFHGEVHSEYPALTAGEWRDVIDQFIALGTRRLHFSGRDPFFAQRTLIDVLEHLRKHEERSRLTVGAITDGFAVSSRALAAAQGVLDYLELSLDGPPDLHDRIRGPGSCMRLQGTLARVRTLLTSTTLSAATTLLAENRDAAIETLAFARSLGIRNHYFQPLQPFGRGADIPGLSDADYADVIRSVSRYLDDGAEGSRVLFFIPRTSALTRADLGRLAPGIALELEREAQAELVHVIVTHDGFVIPHFSARASAQYVDHALGNVRLEPIGEILRGREIPSRIHSAKEMSSHER